MNKDDAMNTLEALAEVEEEHPSKQVRVALEGLRAKLGLEYTVKTEFVETYEDACTKEFTITASIDMHTEGVSCLRRWRRGVWLNKATGAVEYGEVEYFPDGGTGYNVVEAGDFPNRVAAALASVGAVVKDRLDRYAKRLRPVPHRSNYQRNVFSEELVDLPYVGCVLRPVRKYADRFEPLPLDEVDSYDLTSEEGLLDAEQFVYTLYLVTRDGYEEALCDIRAEYKVHAIGLFDFFSALFGAYRKNGPGGLDELGGATDALLDSVSEQGRAAEAADRAKAALAAYRQREECS